MHEELAAALTEARLAAIAAGNPPPAEAYAPTAAEYERSVELAQRGPQPTGGAFQIDPANLPQPMSKAEIDAELERQRQLRNTIEFFGANGARRAYRLNDRGRFRRIPPPSLHRATAQRRTTVPRSTRPAGRRRRRVARARSPGRLAGDDPEPPLRVIPLAAFRRELFACSGKRHVNRAARYRHPNRSRPRPERLLPWERRRLRELSDEELLREARGLNQVDQAVKRYRGKP